MNEETVNWEEQWALFAENFHNGKAHIDLSRFGRNKELLLLPGPGFGDLSHPTTNLCLQMMKGRVKDKSILDVGSGSGILSLASLLLHASSAIGIDIDPEALKHARKNSKLNHLEGKVRFLKKIPHTPSHFDIGLVNMISSEQMEALTGLTKRCKTWIASGILKRQKKEYLEMAHSWGWQPQEEHRKGEWLGWVFSC